MYIIHATYVKREINIMLRYLLLKINIWISM